MSCIASGYKGITLKWAFGGAAVLFQPCPEINLLSLFFLKIDSVLCARSIFFYFAVHVLFRLLHKYFACGTFINPWLPQICTALPFAKMCYFCYVCSALLCKDRKDVDQGLPASLTFRIWPHSEFSQRRPQGNGNFSEYIRQQSTWHPEPGFLRSHLMFSANAKVGRNVDVGSGIYLEF